MNDKPVYRTAPATPGLLITYLRKYCKCEPETSYQAGETTYIGANISINVVPTCSKLKPNILSFKLLRVLANYNKGSQLLLNQIPTCCSDLTNTTLDAVQPYCLVTFNIYIVIHIMAKNTKKCRIYCSF